MPERIRTQLLGAFAVVNNQVNRELGDDFVRYFAALDVRRLQDTEAPVLLIHRAADLRPLAAVEALAGELRRSTLLVFQRVGHFPYWESPALLRSALRDFLRSHPSCT